MSDIYWVLGALFPASTVLLFGFAAIGYFGTKRWTDGSKPWAKGTDWEKQWRDWQWR